MGRGVSLTAYRNAFPIVAGSFVQVLICLEVGWWEGFDVSAVQLFSP